MTVKIDRYIMMPRRYSDNGYCIIDKKYRHNSIVEICTGNPQIDKILCQLVLDELNTGKYGEDD